MPDTQFHPLGTEDAPADWELPPSLEIVPKCVRAVFDGSGAGSAFLPCLVIVSDSGREVGRFPVADSDAVAAGASAEVSWFPGGRVAGGVGGSGSMSVAFAYGSAVQIAAANTYTYITTDTFVTNNPAAFDTATTVIGGNTYAGVRFLEQGTYFMWVRGVGVTGGVPFAAGDIVTFTYDGGGDPFGFFQGDGIVTAPAGLGSGSTDSLGFMEALAVKSTDVPPPTSPQVFKARNNTGARGRIGFNAAYMFVPNAYPYPGL